MPYSFNPISLKIRYADAVPKLGKTKACHVFEEDEDFIKFMHAYMEKKEQDAEVHIKAINDIRAEIEKIQLQLKK